MNLILKTDGYKLSHYEQYPPGTKGIYSYLEARGGKDDFGNGETVFFGLQYLIEKHLTGHVFNMNDIKDAEAFHSKYMPNCKFNTQGWAEMYKEYGGRLPVIINAVPEGSVVPVGNVLMIIENTDDRFFWLTNYLETLLMQVWYPITVASQSYYLKKKLLKFHRLSSDEPESYVDYKLHDFGFRGVSSMETAAIGAAAHLLNFKGTDTLAGIQLLDEYYADETTSSCGSSIPASEHSTITSWGKSREVEAYRNMLKVYPEGFVACVSDSYDIFNACENIWGGELQDKVLNRSGTLAIRPDSGNPLEVLPKILNILGEKFGYTTNSKGFKVLNPKVRVIQGDGINRNSLLNILDTVCLTNKWSLDNLTFGSGGGLLQKLDRDTMGFAIKCSSIAIDDEEYDVYKEPVGQSFKTSKRGRLSLIKENGSYKTVSKKIYNSLDCLQTVFYNGYSEKTTNLSYIKQRLLKSYSV